ncbi:hypothetical protein [Spirosoma agri]|uniref:Uncharacterized protein n=1 Tax=Spirosoma agri TaxID=1987381 RepID=A0A6M0IT69_9BACT|nr:hypothetical protein [Spirosoma agri]NEU70905.1 hypothetical protein [Spirosoma agri]
MQPTTTSLINVSLTDFVDFVICSGGKRLTKVKEIKARGEYEPQGDFYRGLRKGIQDIHQGGYSKMSLDLLSMPSNENKAAMYSLMVEGYKKFWGTKQVEWQDPIRKNWYYRELAVRLNPELYLLIDRMPHVIKLHFRKDERLTKDKVCAIVNLMEEELTPHLPDDVIFGVLDVAKGLLCRKDSRRSNLNLLIRSEADAFISLWNLI